MERAPAALTLKELFDGVLTRMRGEEGLAPTTKCVRERVWVVGVQVSDGDVRMVFVKSGFISENISLV